jgi:hypothetical protein
MICTLYNLRDVEDEFHFILKCPKYQEISKSKSIILDDLAFSNEFIKCTKFKGIQKFRKIFIFRRENKKG